MRAEDEDEPFVGPEPKSSAAILSALKKSEREFEEWQATCHDIDDIYSLHGTGYGGIRGELDSYGWQDTKLDLFWASYEILKPAVYARPPVPAVKPLFSDNKPLQNTTAELLERAAISTFTRTGIDDVMIEVRDDLIFAGRGVPWVRYDTDDGQNVCVEHLDRTDFRHEPARKWAEAGWVARQAWMTKREMRKRFRKFSGDAYKDAKFMTKRDDEHGEDQQSQTRKAGVWEVWHKADNKVYWVTEGVDVLLDSDEPELKLSGFFPCPRPAYGTLRRRSLVPVPDWERYAIHFNKISVLTGRIYLLLEKVKLKGLIPAGGDIGDAVETLMKADDDEILIPVPGAALIAGGTTNFVQWMPLAEVATAIQGLIQARAQLIDDFYQLSGISDIMRGATEAEETLGAQQLKSQYGSVRVRCKIDELQRVAADAVKIAAEIIAEKFSKETLLEMAQMEIPTKADIEKRIKEIEKAAKGELEALANKAKEAATQAMQQGQEGDPAQMQAQAQQAFQQAQQQILAKYAPMLADAEAQVPIEDVMTLLRDDRARSFAFEIETDSTILTDEMQEKQSRNEFMGAFTQASQALMQMAAMGEEGAKLAGEMMKFVLAPYRVGRQMNGVIDEFIDAAPQMAEAARAAAGGGESAELVEANNKLAEAEQMKAQAAMAGVQAKAALDQAENQRKFAELQAKSQNDQAKLQQENQKLQLQLADMATKAEETDAKINKMQAETAKILSSIGLDERRQNLEEYRTSSDQQARQVDQQMAVEGAQTERGFRERGEERADRQQEFSERSAEMEADNG
ncbi:hypothetical protein [Rhizorhapis suberifaciens]|uniref:Uncharacterized protein n=1 Tax=Rhizorhapis suberifaciens TaxID=13656 RepID=A0A840HXI1_9SPHN|nr:hypothetical protein [Rhizorhapis suberifaciens]MBB4642361.1 hypothetical protein [Rhizorhapis suberifaciens]